MRSRTLYTDQYYHIYTRRINKELLFLDERDYLRFLFLILFFQSPTVLNNIGRAVSSYKKQGSFGVSNKTINKIIDTRLIDVVAFSLMPTHIHILLREHRKDGISRYMQRVLTAYAKYFNAKYKRKGYVFEGPFGAVLVEDNNQLLYLSTYIHRQSRELKVWKNKEASYPWSSYGDFIKNNRWGELIQPGIIVEQFDSDPKKYKQFVDTSIAKDKDYFLP